MWRKVLTFGVPFGVLLTLGVLMYVASRDATAAVVDTRGVIGNQQRDLLIFATLTMLVVIVPVFVLLFAFAWRYREGNHRAKYAPNFASSKTLEALWWGIPIIVVVVLSTVAWKTSHSLDPFEPLSSSQKPLNIQVIALQWKWLFIYPQEQVASVNEISIPLDRPVTFTITSDAPMNSFWIPQLGGQIYAMSGMATRLSLDADAPGDYRGYSANISGEGFADMTFTVKARETKEFDQWLDNARSSQNALDMSAYELLHEPSRNQPVDYYHLHDLDLFGKIVDKYGGAHGMHMSSGMGGDYAR